jgi:dipeptidyl aminopeptidase/acylaminoacyl peptidase
MLRSVFTALLLVLLPATLAAQEHSLDAFLSAPFRSALVASDNGARLAWVDQVRGERSINVADAPAFEPRPVYTREGDDGLTIGNLRFTPDGRTIVFTLGIGANRDGEIANPTSAAEAPRQRQMGVDVMSGRSWQIVDSGSGVMSPDGQHIAFSRGADVYRARVDGSGNAERLFYVRRGAGQLAWSPDGDAIAFISSRGDQAYAGVWESGAENVRWLAPSIDRDREPTWSPDGAMIAFYRMEGEAPDAADTIFGPHSEPYAVWVVNRDGSDARELWRSRRDGRDGFPAISGTRPLRWADDNTILFPAESTGWTHIYAVSLDGNVRALTSGECIVEETDFDRNTGWLYYNHNCGDLERRVISRVNVSDGTYENLQDASHIVNWAPTVIGNDFAFIRATWQHPGTVHIMPSTGGEPRAIHSATGTDFPASLMVRPEDIRFESTDGLEISAQLFMPQNAEGPVPAIVYLHGGSRRQMFPAFHYSSYYAGAYAYNQYLASLGYAVLSINFRSGIGYGKDFRQPMDYGWRAASEYRDVKAAGLWLAEHPEVDADRIGLWGGSYGGYLTAMGLARDSDLFKAGFDLHGVHNWVTGLRFWRSERFDSSIPERIAEADSLQQLAWASSPMADVDAWRSPVLFVHGDDDRNVDVHETAELVRLLRDKGDVTIETLIIPDEIHGFLRYDSWYRTYEAATDFFLRHLPRDGRRGASY